MQYLRTLYSLNLTPSAVNVAALLASSTSPHKSSKSRYGDEFTLIMQSVANTSDLEREVPGSATRTCLNKSQRNKQWV